MTRTIQIANVLDTNGNVEPNVRQITITLAYPVGRLKRTYTLISYISSFS